MPGNPPPANGRLLGIAVPVISAVLVASCVMFYLQAAQLRENHRWVDHSYEVRLEIAELNRSLREAEATQRALILGGTATKELEVDFIHLLKTIRPHLDRLSKLVRDNEAQVRLVEKARPILEARLLSLEKNFRDAPELAADDRSRRIATGIAQSDALTRSLDEMKLLEERLLEKRASVSSASTRVLLILATTGSLLGVGLTLVTLFHERRNRRVTQRYQERLAEARDAALGSVKATSVFVASVSHEIRTPMNGVLGAADLLLHGGSLDRRQRELVEAIRYSGEALLALINDILDLSKLQSGKMEFISEDFLLTEVLDEVLGMFVEDSAKKRLELAHRVDPKVPRHLRGDPRRLRQVLVNLVGNAVKFTARGSVAVEVDLWEDGNRRPLLRVQVKDTGVGIAQEEQKKLFQPFMQLGNVPADRRQPGTGLGLAISREIVQRMGGSLGVESEPKKGSVFWFTARFESTDDPEDRCEVLCGGGSLLVIEARELTARSIEQHVLGWGMKVRRVSDMGELRMQPVTEEISAVLVGSPLGESWREVIAELERIPALKGAMRFLLCHPHEIPGPDQLSAAKIDACLRIPFRPSDLYDLLAREHPDPAVSEPANDHGLPPAKILLVEDNPINQRIFGRQLEVLGLPYVICGDGKEGIDAFLRESPDLIMMDCQLPTVDGFEATRRIRALEREMGMDRTPIIAITAHVMVGDAEACLQAGMDDYLPKPFDLGKLRPKLERWLSRPEEKEDPLLDRRQLESCLTGDEKEDRELILEVLAQTGACAKRMKEALEQGDDAVWRHEAHRAAGTGSMVGFAALTVLFRDGETDDGDAGARRALLARIRDVHGRTTTAAAALGFAAGRIAADV